MKEDKKFVKIASSILYLYSTFSFSVASELPSFNPELVKKYINRDAIDGENHFFEGTFDNFLGEPGSRCYIDSYQTECHTDVIDVSDNCHTDYTDCYSNCHNACYSACYTTPCHSDCYIASCHSDCYVPSCHSDCYVKKPCIDPNACYSDFGGFFGR